MHTAPLVTALPEALRGHLRLWAGGLPDIGVRVVAHPANGRPGWDGAPQRLTGLVDPAGNAVVAVPPSWAPHAEDVLTHPGHGHGTWRRRLQLLPPVLGSPGHTVEQVAYRWCTTPADLPDTGEWVDTASPGLPDWLRPFGGKALVAFDDRGRYRAGVGIKRHDDLGNEISVGTEPEFRGQGLAQRLVAQAARHILGAGRIPTYLHTFDNVASSRVAAAAGFSDLGWSALMLNQETAAAVA